MLLYKLRGFKDLDKLLDILLMERLYCAKYQDLNDPFEAMFHIPVPACFGSIQFGTAQFGGSHKKPTTIAEQFKNLPEQRICSLSQNISDVRLWSFYAAGHTGVAIEIDFSDYEGDVCKVFYNPELPIQGTTLLDSKSPKELLQHKTNHWGYESEYRIIGNDEYYPVTGRVKRIIVGHRASKDHLKLLYKTAPHIPIVQAQIDPETVSITFD
jgi:hypothetical protein